MTCLSVSPISLSEKSCLFEIFSLQSLLFYSCLQLAERIVANSLLAEFLTPSFTPNVADVDTFARIYEKIAFDILEDKASLAFVMMSKMSVIDWLRRCRPNPQQRSQLLSLIARSLRQTGPDPSDSRAMVHGQQVRHFSAMALSDFPAHFGESVAILLELTEKQCLDPTVWDLLTWAVVQGAVTGDVTLATALPKEIKSVRLDAGDVKLVLRKLVIQDSIFRLKEV